MSRKVVPFPADEATQAVVRLGRLLDMITVAAENAPPPPTQEALERAGFVRREPPPPDPFAGRRMLAWIEERETRRRLRGRR